MLLQPVKSAQQRFYFILFLLAKEKNFIDEAQAYKYYNQHQ